jgi:hypothetical protein
MCQTTFKGGSGEGAMYFANFITFGINGLVRCMGLWAGRMGLSPSCGQVGG